MTPGRLQPKLPSTIGRRLSRLAGISVRELKGVGVQKAAAFEELGIETILDLIMYYPRKWVDRTNTILAGDLVEGEEALVCVVVGKVTSRRLGGGRSLVTADVFDDSGSLVLSFFNQPWRTHQLKPGVELVAFAKVTTYRGKKQMSSPVVEIVEGRPGDRRQTGRIVAIYPQSGKVTINSAEISSYIGEALERAGPLADPLPDDERRRLGLVDRTTAIKGIHFPESMQDKFAARRRLAFDELLRLQVELVQRKRAAALEARGISHLVRPDNNVADLVGDFLRGLPFSLTQPQSEAISAIASDLSSPYPMHRLLQGDVGSGKTVVALATLLYAVQGGHQGALMVPTEVLAEQHFLSANQLISSQVGDQDRLGGMRSLEVALLTARTGAPERTRIKQGLAQGTIDIVVGTHALLTDDVVFASLGAVVIDEQHRFGVDQRASLRDKGAGSDPDLLVMTATPIPRTAAMTVYGDLDTTVLDQSPQGRQPVETHWLEAEDANGEAEAFIKIKQEAEQGRQAFVVCPLVSQGDAEPEDASGEGLFGLEVELGKSKIQKDSRGTRSASSATPRQAKRQARAAVEERARLMTGELAGLNVGLLHGQMTSKEKEEAMQAFRQGKTQVLVATTVIEVGVDVGNATVMVILDADRFGIAQLHQLRGRVGRGSAKSWCYLIASEVTDEARQRLEALVASNDGFELADVDLELRGEGTVLGVRQKGRNDLRLASIRRDGELVLRARAVAERLVGNDPTLGEHELLRDELRLFIASEQGEYLQRS